MRNKTEGRECVVLLHGLGRSAWSMRRLARFFRTRGYVVWCKTYPSRRHKIEELAEQVFAEVFSDERVLQCEKIHFVTHSLGGILLRQWFQVSGRFESNSLGDASSDRAKLAVSGAEKIGRVVMLGAPNQGSDVTDFFRHWPLYQWLTGPAGSQLGTRKNDLPRSLKAIDLDVGVIAGTRSADPWFASLFAGEHDGKVSVSSTRLAEMADFVALPVGHTLMMWNKEVIEQAYHFIREGYFLPVASE